jgi:hypothetical protein
MQCAPDNMAATTCFFLSRVSVDADSMASHEVFGCPVVTLFMLSVLYDIVGDKVLKRREFLMVAPFVYFALAMFFTGFIYMVQLTTLVVAQA